ncbi:LysR family transcriptional regulator [Roseovarius sp. CAU 1744]|uniref:LysR family transcriptional regulator n=1 Tax=Roseovarius sp. CAU 1744 TaxID=3140368 RepID=UPI00325AABC1
MNYDLQSLLLFKSVVSSGSIAGAAELHNIAASAVSRRISDVEIQIGTALFYRQRRGVELTPAGEEFLVHVSGLLNRVARMDQAMEDFADGLKGVVRIAANTSSITQFLPEDLAEFVNDFPGVRIKLVEMFSTDVMAQVRMGHADLGICSGLTNPGDLDATLYRRDTLVLAVPEGHPLASRSSVSLGDILDQDIVSLQDGSSIQAYVDAKAEIEGRMPKTRVQVMSFDGVRRMVEAHLGVAILPHGAVLDASRDSKLTMVPIAEPWAERELLLVRKPGVQLGRASQVMFEYLTGHSRPQKP